MGQIDYNRALILQNETNTYMQSLAEKLGASQNELVIALTILLCERQRLAHIEAAYSTFNKSSDEEEASKICHT
jgi:hypothetical protein